MLSSAGNQQLGFSQVMHELSVFAVALWDAQQSMCCPREAVMECADSLWSDVVAIVGNRDRSETAMLRGDGFKNKSTIVVVD